MLNMVCSSKLLALQKSPLDKSVYAGMPCKQQQEQPRQS